MFLQLLREHYFRSGLFIRLWTLKQPFIWFGLSVVYLTLYTNADYLPWLITAALFIFIAGLSHNKLTAFILLFSFVSAFSILSLYRLQMDNGKKLSKSLPGYFSANLTIQKIAKSGLSGSGKLNFIFDDESITVPVRFLNSASIPFKEDHHYFVQAEQTKWNRPVYSGEFDEKRYNASQGCYVKIKIRKALEYEYVPYNGSIKPRIGATLRNSLNGYVSDQATGLLMALFSGDKNGLDNTFIDDFRHLGLMHLFAVSGFHIGLLFALVLKLIPGRKGNKKKVIFALLFVWGYISFIAFPVSAVRAGIMLSSGVWGVLNGRRILSWANFWLAFFLIIVFLPGQIASPGFVLSFSALAGILFFLPTINHHVFILKKRNVHPIILYFLSIFEVSIAAQIGVLLPATYWFGEINILSPFINIFFVPFVILYMTLSIPLTVLSIAHFIPAVKVLNYLSYFLGTVGHETSVLFMGFSPWKNGPFFILLFFILLLYYWSRRAWAADYLNFALILSLIILLFTQPFDLPVEVSQLDVGQGDACYISSFDNVWFVDAGHKRNRHGRAMAALANEHRVKSIFITHPDEDHYGGLLTVSPLMEGGQLFVSDTAGGSWYRDVIQQYRKNNNDVEVLPVGTILKDKFIRIYCLDNGRFGRKFGFDKNNSSLVLLIITPSWKYLLMGDAEARQEQYLSSWKPLISDAMLKVGHHGSRNGSSEAFLDDVHPQLAVISCGEKNRYGHPHRETLDRLEKKGINIYRIDENGYWKAPEIELFPFENRLEK